jgi:HEPN domain-containing protein
LEQVSVGMTKADFERLTDERLDDARTLLAAGRWSAAYYLAGYAVECALKACIAKLIKAGDFPDKRLAEKSWSHEIEKLVDAAGLKTDRDNDFLANPKLAANWSSTTGWNEKSRYDLKSRVEAEALFAAITDMNDGVLPWIKARW